MTRIFVAHAFRSEDRGLVALIDQLLASHDARAVTGERLGGGGVTREIRERISECDGLVAILTRRDRLERGAWTTHDWVNSELQFARDREKPAIALVEDGVEVGGAYSEHERIHFTRERLAEALLALSETVGEWKRSHGRKLIQILPEDIASALGEANRACRCRYRFWVNGEERAWKDGKVLPLPGGTFVVIKGVHDDYLVQLEVEVDGASWWSKATAQHVPVNLIAKRR